jgi:hypothetical protein
MSNKYEVSVHTPHPSMENRLAPGYWRANQENVDQMFDAGATEIGLYVVLDGGNRRFVKRISEASRFADALRFAYKRYAPSSSRRAFS